MRAPGAAIASLAAAMAAIGAGCTTPAPTNEEPGSGLRAFEAGTGSLPFVLLHGYGSSPREWMPYTLTIVLPPGRRFVLPEGPETTSPPDGPPGGRAWWHLDLASYRRPADGLPDMSSQNPRGLTISTTRVRRLLHDLTPGGYARETQMLGGYSQGAMIAADLAFTTDEPLRCLVLLSPTFVNEQAWRAGMPRRKGLRVFVSHGRRDDILPFDASERLAQAMRDAGLDVTWFAFGGGHEMTVEVVTALNRFLAVEPQ